MNYGNLYRFGSDELVRAATEDELLDSLQALEEGDSTRLRQGVALVGVFCRNKIDYYVSGFSEEALNSTGGVPDDWGLVRENGVVVGFDFEGGQ